MDEDESDESRFGDNFQVPNILIMEEERDMIAIPISVWRSRALAIPLEVAP